MQTLKDPYFVLLIYFKFLSLLNTLKDPTQDAGYIHFLFLGVLFLIIKEYQLSLYLLTKFNTVLWHSIAYIQ